MTGIFDNVPRTSFPLRMELTSITTGETVWEHTVTGKGVVAEPSLDGDQGPVRSRITFADGLVAETDPDENGRPARTRVMLPGSVGASR